LTPYSNWGTSVEIIAPGGWTERGCPKPADGVLSMVETSTDRGPCGVPPAYAYYNGTSMATPHVAGVAALWLAQDPSLTPSKLLSELQAAARPRSATECPNPCGAGLLSAVRKDGGIVPVPEQLSVTLALNPDKTSYAIGETAAARATVQKNGAPEPGKTVTFSSSNASVASVSPGSAVSDQAGQASATVMIAGPGQATVTASADGATASKTVSSPMVPDLSPAGLLMLLAGVILIALKRAKPA
jgi:serine protease